METLGNDGKQEPKACCGKNAVWGSSQEVKSEAMKGALTMSKLQASTQHSELEKAGKAQQKALQRTQDFLSVHLTINAT